MLTYCIAVPVPHKPVSPASHKNFVNVSSLVRLYVVVLDLMNIQPDWETSERTGVWGNPVKINSPALWAHHLMVWNNRRYIYFINLQKNLRKCRRLFQDSRLKIKDSKYICTNPLTGLRQTLNFGVQIWQSGQS